MISAEDKARLSRCEDVRAVDADVTPAFRIFSQRRK
jgi:hypothetical protein